MSLLRKRVWTAAPMLFLVMTAASASLWARGEAAERGVYNSRENENPLAGELIVQLREGVDRARMLEALEEAGARFERDLLVDGFALVRVPEGEEDALGEALAGLGGVATVERNGVKRPAGWVPNDPIYKKDGMDFFEQWNLQIIQMEQAWAEFPADGSGKPQAGAGARVAVIDTGVAFEAWLDQGTVYLQAPDLQGITFVDPYDALDAADPDYTGEPVHPNDVDGHGTHVTGTIAQATDNGHRTAGIAFAATVIPIRACASVCPNAAVADAINWAVDHGADVINLSLAGDGLSAAEDEAIQRAAGAGVVLIAASGNWDPATEPSPVGIKWPALHDSVISVGATGRPPNDDPAASLRAGLSRYGPGLDIVGPGGAVRFPDDPGKAENAPVWQETYRHVCDSPSVSFTAFQVCGVYGTSMATAHVSGVATLIRSQYPNASRTQVRNLLLRCAIDIGPAGYDIQHGNGLVQAYNAIRDENGDGIPDGLQDTDNDGVWDCVDDDVDPPPTPTPPANLCDAPTPTPAASPTPSPTPTATPTPAPTDTPTPPPDGTPTPTPEPTETETPAPTGTQTPVPTETGTPTPAPTDTPTPAPTDTPTPSPNGGEGASAPTPLVIACGDTDCDGDVDAVDALNILRFVASLGSPAPCIGYGYTDCNDKLEATDALVVLRHVAQLPLGLDPGCPQVGYG